ncbi:MULTISPECIES: MbnP family copper-binding protein [unclassified Microcoleus]|uniref:MbnP family copper-binding protein n=1 Tax=unclassified Microcoleus TaxID=2642155 RepID=UPI002FD1E4A4
MKKQLILASTAAGIGILCSYSAIDRHQATAAETQAVEIKFSAMVGEKPFNCGESYSNLGTSAATVTPTDFRFYVSDAALIDASGKAVPLTLKQDGKWQHQNVALLDFENKSGACANGTVEIRDRLIGTIPKGSYKGLQFTLGVPSNLNHEDASLAPSPLNLTSLWWNWRGGYKFLRIDIKNQMVDQKPDSKSGKESSPIAHNAGSHGSSHGGGLQGFMIHLGSTGCKAEGNNQKPTTCANANTSKVILSNFDSTRNTVIVDLKSLVSQTNLAVNQANTPPGCMSEPNDGDCAGIMTNLGLPFGDKPAARQTFFQVK